jgi:hypothetical protein
MQKKIFVQLIVIVLLALTALLPASAVYAAPGITSIVPDVITNDTATTITITGTGIPADVVVFLEGYGVLDTTFISGTLITAVVPAGISAGWYDITLVSTSGSSGAETLKINDPIPFGRPQIALANYRVSGDEIKYGTEFNLVVKLENAGQVQARNVQAAFTSSELTPLKTGGVAYVGNIAAHNRAEFDQRFTLNAPVYTSTIPVTMAVTYYDTGGTAFTDTFTLSLPVASTYTGGGTSATATPTGVRSAQLVITKYDTNIEPLQPGLQFTLNLTVENMGNVQAQRVVMIVGGGTTGGGGETPQPGGVSGGSGEFTNFAPLGTSNVQSLGNLTGGGILTASQNLIVNVNTAPGAYPMPITFSYLDADNNVINDQQVITLLVYRLPNIDINFYTQPMGFFAMQPNALPLQVVNLGRSTAVLGNMRIESADGYVENGTLLIGSLEPGGYTTLDALVTPNMAGALNLNITIDYTDDFGQARAISKTMTLDVMEGYIEPTPDPNMPIEGGGEFMPVEEETFWQKTWRFILGLFGLDSGSNTPIISPVPGEGEPVPGPIIVPGGKGG